MVRDARSRMHVLDWVESRNEPFASSLNDLIRESGATVGTSDVWMPKGRASPDEVLLSRPNPLVPPELSAGLRRWWLAVDHPKANEPNWDLAATATFPNGVPGIVLVEAKAYAGELRNERKGKSAVSNPRNHSQIGAAIEEARVALDRIHPGVAISRDSHYQFSNRVAFAWKLAALGVPTALVYLGFTGDTGIPAAEEPLRDLAHWVLLIEQHMDGRFPAELVNCRIECGAASMWVFVRSIPCARCTPLREPSPSPVNLSATANLQP